MGFATYRDEMLRYVGALTSYQQKQVVVDAMKYFAANKSAKEFRLEKTIWNEGQAQIYVFGQALSYLSSI